MSDFVHNLAAAESWVAQLSRQHSAAPEDEDLQEQLARWQEREAALWTGVDAVLRPGG